MPLSLFKLLSSGKHTMSNVNFFRLEKRLFSVFWFWPSREVMKPGRRVKFALNSALMFTAVFGELNFALSNIHNLSLALNALAPTIPILGLILKILILFSQRREVADLLANFKRKMESGQLMKLC